AEDRARLRELASEAAALGRPKALYRLAKSVSGLRFPVEEGFENCQLCPRQGCPGRRAPYAPEIFARRYSGLDKIHQ
ncbi:MAG: hypothetical protein K6U03_08105, partial [Firmicutes bacterium]|nr:hypothetical protein [Bacillota bacterium]